MEIIFATGNENKAKEVRNLFEKIDVKIKTLKDIGFSEDIEENGNSFEENAFIKAKTIYNLFNLPVIADDSGLEVEQLNNRPGIFSARYAGENCTFYDNNIKLLDELKSFPQPHLARFVCSAVYYDGENKIVCNGILEGEIIKEFRGEKGFGYDPIFLPKGFEKTLAELSMEEKNSISHRGKAFLSLYNEIIKLLD